MATQSLFGHEIPNHILKSLISVLTPRFSWSCMIDLHRRQQTVSVDKVAALKVLDFNSSRRHKLSRFVSACSVPIKLNATSKLINRQQERTIVKAVHRISKTRIPKLIKKYYSSFQPSARAIPDGQVCISHVFITFN